MQRDFSLLTFNSKSILRVVSMTILISFQNLSTNSFIISFNKGTSKKLPNFFTELDFHCNQNFIHCEKLKNFNSANKDQKMKSIVTMRSSSIDQDNIDDCIDDVSSYQEEVNMLCNDIVRAILASDEYKVKQLRYKVEDNHARLCGFDETTGEVKSRQMWLFLASLLKVMEHDLHVDADKLEGHYSESYIKIIGLIEDSGWQLTAPVEQVSG